MNLSLLQRQAYEILSGSEKLSAPGVSVYRVDKADVAAAYAEALATSGVSVGVLPATARFRPDSDGPVTEDGGVTLRVNVSEPVEAARAQGAPPVTDLADEVGRLLHSQNWPERRDAAPLGLASIDILPDKEALIMQVTLRATVSL